MLFTIADARTLVAPYVEAGACPTSTMVLTRINEAIRRLMNKATWWNLQTRIRFYTTNNTITMPREVEKVLRVDIDGYPANAFHQAYEFLEGGPGELCGDGGVSRDLLDLGDGFPTFFDIPPADTATTSTDEGPCRVAAFSTSAEDQLLNLTLWGRDTHAAEIINSAGDLGITLPITQWDGGVEGKVHHNNLMARANAVTTESFSELTGVAKPVTKGHVCLYTYEPTTHRMYFLAKYHPDETRPSYRRYRITAPGMDDHTNVLCFVKLRYVPAIRDTDVLLIQNLDAIKLMVQAIREENDRQAQGAEIYEQKAYRLLNEEHNSKQNVNVIPQLQDNFGLGSVVSMV